MDSCLLNRKKNVCKNKCKQKCRRWTNVSARFVIIWLIIISVSWYLATILMLAQYDSYYNNPISFVVETTYKDWDTDFPTVAICETNNVELLEHVADKIWKPNHNFNLEEVLNEIAFFKGVTYYSERFCGVNSLLDGCPTKNLSHYASLVRKSCEELITNCSWNKTPFECCLYFRPVDTELGLCFAINSVQGREANPPMLKMISNRMTGPGKVYFQVTSPANVGVLLATMPCIYTLITKHRYLHQMFGKRNVTHMTQKFVYVINDEEVPSVTTQQTDILNVQPDFNYKREFVIRNIENDPTARRISPDRRKCRYKDENYLQVHRYYSYSACTVQCRKDAQLKFCGCCNFLMPNTTDEEKCDIFKLICLDDNHGKQKFHVLKASWSKKSGLVCDCLPSCTEAEISVVRDTYESTENGVASVEIAMSALPGERYRRKVVRDTMDLIVSLGGTAGLFMGASILSFIEIFYLVFLRTFCGSVVYRWVEGSDRWHQKFEQKTLENSKFVANSRKS